MDEGRRRFKEDKHSAEAKEGHKGKGHVRDNIGADAVHHWLVVVGKRLRIVGRTIAGDDLRVEGRGRER